MASNQSGETPLRRITASGRTWSLRRQAKVSSSPPQIKTVQQQLSSYELDWDDLKAFLEKTFPLFPKELFVEDKSEDHYHLNLPEKLTDEDHAEIKKLKKSHMPQVQRAVTPD